MAKISRSKYTLLLIKDWILFSKRISKISEFKSNNLKRYYKNYYLILFLPELLFYLLHIFGIEHLIMFSQIIFKKSLRHLTKMEEVIYINLFGTQDNLDLVLIDENSFFGPKQYHFYYVFCYHINGWKSASESLIAHELVHVRQYNQMGLVYICRALWAQQTKTAYKYEHLCTTDNPKLCAQQFDQLNLEQQASLLADLYIYDKYYKPGSLTAFKFSIEHSA